MKLWAFPWLVIATFLLDAPKVVWAKPPASSADAGIIKALSDPNLKIRIKAVMLTGTRKIKKAKDQIRRMLQDEQEHETVRAAAAISLGKIQDEESRRPLAYLIGHKSELLAKGAEKGLILLDQARPQKPYYLMALEPPKLPKDSPGWYGERIGKKIANRLNRTGGVVPGAGEHTFLQDEELKGHLERRKLIGLLLQPELMQIKIEPEGGKTVFWAKVSITSLSLPEKETQYSGGGEANSWIEGTRITETERQELINEVLDNSADAALMQYLQELGGQ